MTLSIKYTSLLLFVVGLNFYNRTEAFDLSTLLGDVMGQERGGLLLSDIEHRTKQMSNLENEMILFKEKQDDANREISKKLGDIQQEVKTTEEGLQSATGAREELLKNKLAVLEDRKQNLITTKDLLVEGEGKIGRHAKLIEEILALLKINITRQEGRVIYAWKDLDETKGNIDKLASQVVDESAKLERLKKLQVAEKEEISSLKKEIDAKSLEREKALKEIEGVGDIQDGLAVVSELKVKVDIIEQEILFLREKIKVSELKTDDYGRDARYKEDEVFLLKQRLKKASDEFVQIQKRLVVDISDVEVIKNDFEKVKRESVKEISRIMAEKSMKKIARDGRNGVQSRVKYFERQLAAHKQTGVEVGPNDYLIESRLALASSEKNVIDRQLDFLDTRKEREEIIVDLKQLRLQIVETLYAIGLHKETGEERLVEFKTKMRAAEYTKKVQRGKHDEIIGFISTINKEIEALQVKQKEVEDQREKMFKMYSKEYFEVLTNFRRASLALSAQKSIVERHFSHISELIGRQDAILNQYSFIVKYLESQKAVGMWKRSPRAISIERVVTGFWEMEQLFKGLFWETPAYLNPVSLVKSVKAFSLIDFLGILLFLLLFLFFYLAIRLLLITARSHVKGAAERFCSPRIQHFCVTVFEDLLSFIQKHFLLLFTWIFFLLHVMFGLTYFKPLSTTYSVTVFYLISIPVAIVLSRLIVVWLRRLNQKLQFLFISEPLQWKFSFLIEIFLYATAILLPLRKAFLVYFDNDVSFAEVSLAAYTLILVIIVLFFFNKEDLLRLLAGRGRLIVWFREKVDRYYYPVFIFFMLLLILSNPYIGYSNLAWYLAFAVPASIFLLYGFLLLHYVLRFYSLFLFIKEEDNDVINKFEHAKAYYGLFVVVSFITFSFVFIVALARIWGIEGYTLGDLWKTLSDDWIVRTGTGLDDKLGFIELGKLAVFITSGLVISSFIKKFILGKLFEIFRTEPGVQNTISKILHYFVIIVAVILGFTAINLSQYALTVGGLLLVGVGFGLKDQITDYFAGILILLERPIEIGHYVGTGEHEGRVHRISARSTTLKTARNFFITIPNRDLISKAIINWGQGRYAVGCELKVMVSYDSDLEKVRKILLEIMRSNSMILRVPAPIVRFEGFESNSLYFYCRGYISSRKLVDMWDLQSDLRFAVVKNFRENNIVIPYDHLVVHFADDGKKKEAAGMAKNPIEIKFDKKD